MWSFLLILVHFVSFSAVKKSSEIPARREFPVNEKVNPCDDFYKYTCSKVDDSFKLREDRSSHIFSFSDSSERLLKTKESYLKNLTGLQNKTPGEKELSDVFMACLNTDQRAIDEKKLVEKVKSELSTIKTREEFAKFLGSRVGGTDYTFFDFGKTVNHNNVNKNDLIIVASLGGLPERSYYEDKKVLGAYQKLAADFFKTIGFKDYKDRAKKLVKFEVAFDKTFPLPKEWRPLYASKNYLSREKLLNDYSIFHLEDFMAKIPKKTVIRDITPESFEFIKNALKTTDLDTLKSVFLIRALSDKMDEGFKSYYDKKFAFNKEYLGGSKKRKSLTERCTYYVKGSFSKEIDYELYPRVFKDFSKPKFLKLVESIRGSIVAELKENTWLSKKARKNAIKKMKKARLQVVKPNNKKEWDLLEAADYSPRHYLANRKLRSSKYNEKTFKELKTGPNRVAWLNAPLTVNAYYYPPTNGFTMLAGILQYPFYDQNLPDHINLGGIGSIVGHELGHAVDDNGSKYDYKGRLRQWMTKDDLDGFKKRGSLLIKQFDAAGNNGEFTLGENIGDLVGLSAAYRVAFPNGEGSIKMKQEFFTQYGRNWCGVMRPGTRKRLIKTDEHALHDARVNEQVKHQKGFIEAFSCKKGDKMYLSEENRVKIW